jgi:hypothetical protein
LNERNEDHKIFNAGNAFTTECHIPYGEGQVFANSRTHVNHVRKEEAVAKEKSEN